MKIGKFKLAQEFVRNNPNWAIAMLKGTVAVDLIYRFETDELHYTLLGEMFEDVPLGSIAPYYEIKITENDEKIWQKISTE